MVMNTGGRARFAIDDTVSPLDDLIGSNAADLLARKYDLVNNAVVKRGMVVGITSGGAVARSMTGAGDGTDTPFGIAAIDADEAAGDTEVLVFVRGSFNEREVERLLGAGDDGDGGHTWTDSSLTIAGIREGLRDKGIYLEKPVRRYPE